jgi:hypothetical protein
VSTEEKDERDRRLESVGWGLLLVITGTIRMLPEGWVPPGTWLIATGAILVGVNLLRYFNGIPTRGFSIVVGTVALTAGIDSLLGLSLPVVAIALILAGGCILLRSVAERGPACA